MHLKSQLNDVNKSVISKMKASLQGAESTSDLFARNEANGNMMAATMCLFFAISHVISLVMVYLDLFDAPADDSLLFSVINVVFLVSAYVICKVRKGYGKYLKQFLLFTILISAAFIDLMFNYSVTLVFVMPVIASIRYFSKSTTRNVALLTLFVFTLNAIYHTKFYNHFTDVNYMGFHGVKEIKFIHSMAETMIHYGFSTKTYPYFYMIEGFLPRVIHFTVIAVFSVLIAVKGRELVLEEEVIASEQSRLENEVTTAATIQNNMLPHEFPNNDNYEIYASMVPAKEIGGDFYDFFMVDDTHLAIVVADVSGKGVPASLFMMIGKMLIKENTYPGCDLGEVFSKVNEKLCENNKDGLFITAFEGILDLTNGEFRYVNAGHELPFIYRYNEKFEPYNTNHAFVLGGMPGIRYKEGKTITLKPGDAIFQYTDGVTEATNNNNELFGMKRLEDTLNNCKSQNVAPDEFLDAVKQDIAKFVDGAAQFDDITMLGLHFKSYFKQS